MAENPKITFIDDHTEELSPLAAMIDQSGCARSKVYLPEDVDKDLLKSSDLVVVDYSLNKWIDEAPVDQLCLRPINGVALAAVLRQHSIKLKEYPPTGFALITGQPQNLGPLPDEVRPHVISRLNNVEWYFEKGPTIVNDNMRKVISLATAIAALPGSVKTELADIDGLMRFLGVAEHELVERLKESVQRCRPPIHHLAERSHGLIVLRWLLHRILPHTAFLIDERTLAARLNVTPNSLRAQPSTSALFKLFEPMRYAGPLSNFNGNRWWRDGVEQLLWVLTSGESASAETIHVALEKEGATHLDPVDLARPVVTLNHQLITEDDLSSANDVVAIHLDDWPSYAEPAYVRKKELSEHEELRPYVADFL